MYKSHKQNNLINKYYSILIYNIKKQNKNTSAHLMFINNGKNQEKIRFNNALILLGQHWTNKNLVQYCSRGSRQHCTGKHYAQCYLNTFGTTVSK